MLASMTEQQVIEMLVRRLGDGTQTALAEQIGVTPQYLHDVLNNRRAPGAKILEFLRLEKREEYVQVRNGR